MRSAQEDLTTKARIRDAAILRFASDGLEAPLRAIAADASVSPGLIMHHFGSRAGLREACDTYVLQQVWHNKSSVLGNAGAPGAMLAQLAEVEGYAPLVGYTLRCLQEGGELTRKFVDGVVADAAAYLADAVAAGTVSPSRVPEERARVLAEISLGSLLLQLPTGSEPFVLEDLPRWLRRYTERILLPFLELFTEPLLTDSTLLDTYLANTDRSKK